MSNVNTQHHGLPADAFDQLRHDLLNPLATIRGRAQLMRRAVDRSVSISDDDRTRLLRGLAAIEQAVLAAVEVLDRTGSDPESPQPAGDC
ncbi:MAG: hypothetical protein R2853_10730 [Thermomicrobiales bacterium]